MPLYNFICATCKAEIPAFRKIAERDSPEFCSCGGEMQRGLSAPMLAVSVTTFQAYKSPGTGKFIDSRDAQREDLKRSGAFLYEPGVNKDVARNKRDRQEKTFAPIAAAVDQTVAALVQSGKMESL